MGGCQKRVEELENEEEAKRRCDCGGPGSSKDSIKEVIEEGLGVKAGVMKSLWGCGSIKETWLQSC